MELLKCSNATECEAQRQKFQQIGRHNPVSGSSNDVKVFSFCFIFFTGYFMGNLVFGKKVRKFVFNFSIGGPFLDFSSFCVLMIL